MCFSDRKSSILAAILDFSKFRKDVHHPSDIPKYHIKYENDPIHGFGGTRWYGQTDRHTHTQTDRTRSKIPLQYGLKWNNNTIKNKE